MQWREMLEEMNLQAHPEGLALRLPPALNPAWSYDVRPGDCIDLRFYQRPPEDQALLRARLEALPKQERRSHRVWNLFRGQLGRFWCYNLPGIQARMASLDAALSEELGCSSADDCLGVVHLLCTSRFIKLGSSSLRVYVKDAVRLKACPLRRSLERYVRLYLRPRQAVLTRLPVVMLTRTRAQAALLEKWMHCWLRVGHKEEARIPQGDGQGKTLELYQLGYLDMILGQLEIAAQKSATQLLAGIEGLSNYEDQLQLRGSSEAALAVKEELESTLSWASLSL